MFHFNDKLYFWGINPVTQIYSHVGLEEKAAIFAREKVNDTSFKIGD
jgi:ABC-type transporter lipoprotein component MlaA